MQQHLQELHVVVGRAEQAAAAAEEFRGIARFKASGVQDLLEKGSLIVLLTDWAGDIFPLYALYPSRHLPAAKVRAFIDFVIEILDAKS